MQSTYFAYVFHCFGFISRARFHDLTVTYVADKGSPAQGWRVYRNIHNNSDLARSQRSNDQSDSEPRFGSAHRTSCW